MSEDYVGRICEFLLQYFNIQADIKPLAGYQDRNYLVTDSSGKRFVLKITVDSGDLDFIKSQNRILVALSAESFGQNIPFPQPNLQGELISEISMDGKPAFARLFHFLEGEFLAECKPDLPFYFQLGEIFGQIDHTLEGLEDAVLKCRTHEWDLARVMEMAEDVHLITNPDDRRLVHYFLMKYREEVVPVYQKLPKQLIHGDGNDWNILVTGCGPRFRGDDKCNGHGICGILDFGDMVYGARVHEVAIVLAYAMMGREDYGEVYKELIKGYESVIKLSVEEWNVMGWMVAARWCQTMVMAARQERDNPGSAYHQVSVMGARGMLQEWVRRNPVRARRAVPVQGSLGEHQLVERRYRYFSKAVSLSYPEPIQMVGAAFQYMYGADGRSYLDCVNNIPHVGHCHPKVVEAGQRQMAQLNTNTRYLYKSLDLYAEKLLAKFPPTLNKVFFVNSGSAATDLAVRLIKAHTGRDHFWVLDHAYHGNTQSAIGLSPYKFNRKGGRGKPENVEIIPLKSGVGSLESGVWSRESGVGSLEKRSRGDQEERRAGGFFAEPIPGCAGQVMLNREYLQNIYREVRGQGGVCVSDEVQTGFGRVGHKFWGYELYDVVPDIVLLGKPIANGHPMGAVVCTEEIAKSFETGMEFFSSFGGNPVSCEIARAVLEVIEEEGLQENAKKVGEFLIDDLRRTIGDLPTGHASRVTSHVSEVRGSGLFLGIEFVKDLETLEPEGATAKSIVYAMKERGFLLSTDGPYDNVIKFKPPMCFSMDNARELVEGLRLTILGCR